MRPPSWNSPMPLTSDLLRFHTQVAKPDAPQLQIHGGGGEGEPRTMSLEVPYGVPDCIDRQDVDRAVCFRNRGYIVHGRSADGDWGYQEGDLSWSQILLQIQQEVLQE